MALLVVVAVIILSLHANAYPLDIDDTSTSDTEPTNYELDLYRRLQQRRNDLSLIERLLANRFTNDDNNENDTGDEDTGGDDDNEDGHQQLDQDARTIVDYGHIDTAPIRISHRRDKRRKYSSLNLKRPYTRKPKLYDPTNKYLCVPNHRDLVYLMAGIHGSFSGTNDKVRFCKVMESAKHVLPKLYFMG